MRPLALAVSLVLAASCTTQQRAAVVHAATECRVVDLPPPICVSPVDAVAVLAELVSADADDRDAVLELHGPDGVRVVTVPRALVRAAADAIGEAL